MKTPYELVSAVEPVRLDSKQMLLKHVRALEDAALHGPDVAFAVATLQDARFLTPRTLSIYAELASRGCRVALVGRGLHASLAPGVHGVDLDEDDPLGDEWDLLLAGRTFRCFAARDASPRDGEDALRSFAWAETCDPGVVSAVHASLSARDDRVLASLLG